MGVGGKAGRPALGARGCLHDNPSRDGAAQWHLDAALHNAVSRWVYSQYRLDEQVSNCSMAACGAQQGSMYLWAAGQIAQHRIGHLSAVLLKSLLFWYRLKPMYPDTHDMVYDTSQSQIDHLAHSELILTQPGFFVMHGTRWHPSQQGRELMSR